MFNTINPGLKNAAHELSREEAQLYYQIALIGQRDLPLAPTAQIGFEMIVMRMMAFTPNESNITSLPAQKNRRALPSVQARYTIIGMLYLPN